VTEANEAERARWNDDDWTRVWPKRERLTDTVTSALLEAAAPAAGERALDIGCGGGRTTVAVAHAVAPDGHVVGADVSEQLLRLAETRARGEHAFNVSFHRLDVQTDPIPEGPFDLALSQFGVMFFDEPVVAFSNVRGRLRPGGRFVFACWRETDRNPWFPGHAAAPFMPPPPEPAPGKSRTGPFTLADFDRTKGILEAAGFERVERTTHDQEIDVPLGSLYDEVQLHFLGVPDERIAEAAGAVGDYLQQFATGGEELRVPIAFQIVSAHAPAG
jgi:SAM-dependent methyltransferase